MIRLLIGLRWLRGVAVAMKNDFLEVCPHCRRDFRVRVSDDIGFHAHWVGNYFLIDVVLIVPESALVFGLYHWVYSESFKERMFRWQKE